MTTRPITGRDYLKAFLIFSTPIIIVIVVLLLFSCNAFGNDLPDAPVAKPQTTPHRFYDRIGKIELGSVLVVASADSAQTCHSLANGGHEYWQPSQTCAGNVLILFGGVAAQEAVAYGFHRLGWHKPERFVRFFTIQASLRGIRYSARHGGL